MELPGYVEPKTFNIKGLKGEALDAALEEVRGALVPGVPVRTKTFSSFDLSHRTTVETFFSDGTLSEKGTFGVARGERNFAFGQGAGDFIIPVPGDKPVLSPPGVTGDYFSTHLVGCADRGPRSEGFSYGGTETITIGEGEEFIPPSTIAALQFAQAAIIVDTGNMNSLKSWSVRMRDMKLDDKEIDHLLYILQTAHLVSDAIKSAERLFGRSHGDPTVHEVKWHRYHDPERGGDKYSPIIMQGHTALPTDFHVGGGADRSYGILRIVNVRQPLFLPSEGATELAELAFLPRPDSQN